MATKAIQQGKQSETPSMKTQTIQQPSSVVASTTPALSSCRKKNNNDDATFFENIKDHFDQFIHSSMDEHKTCFKNTMDKWFGMSKAAADKNKDVETSVPLQTTTAASD